MTLYAQAKERLTQAIKGNDVNSKSAIRVLIAKLQTYGKEDDESVISTAKSLIKQTNEEIEGRYGRVKMPDGTIKEVIVTSDQSEEISRLRAESIVLESFLPQYLSVDKITEILKISENYQKVANAKNEGAATGIAIKILKEHGPVDGAVVKEVATKIFNKVVGF